MLLRKITLLVIVAIVLITITYFNPGDHTSASGANTTVGSSLSANVHESISELNTATEKPDPFSSIEIGAKSAYVLDASTGKPMYEKNGETPLALASITKIMTVIVALNYIKNPDYIITITSDDLATEGESGLIIGENWKLKDLASFTLINSSNDGAAALGRVAAIEAKMPFSELCKEMSQKVGLKQSYFQNPTGLDETETTSGSYGSARDVALLMKYAINNYFEIFEYTSNSAHTFVSQSGYKHVASNTNSVVNSSVGIIASKTGTTNLAGANLVIAFNAGPARPIIISLLGSTPEDRFIEIELLAKTAIEALSLK